MPGLGPSLLPCLQAPPTLHLPFSPGGAWWLGDAQTDGGSLAKGQGAQDRRAALSLPLPVTVGACWKVSAPVSAGSVPGVPVLDGAGGGDRRGICCPIFGGCVSSYQIQMLGSWKEGTVEGFIELALETGCLWVAEGWRWVVAAETGPSGLVDHSCPAPARPPRLRTLSVTPGWAVNGEAEAAA